MMMGQRNPVSETATEPAFSLGDQLSASANIFIDPASAVKGMEGKYAWMAPVVITCVVGIVSGMIISPISAQIMQANPPEGMTPEQLEKALSMTATIGKVMVAIVPILTLLKLAVLGGIMAGLSAMLDVKTSFRRMFTLVSYCSLIPMLQGIAATVVVKAKEGQLSSMQQLQPPFGLDLLFTETSKPVWAILNYFSIFTIWYLVILALAYSFMTGASRTKAIMAITPIWVLSLLFSLLGAVFQR